MAASKRATKKDLESKIVELESKIDALVAGLQDNAAAKPDGKANAASKAEPKKPKGALPKGFDKPVPKPEPKKAEAAEAAKPKKPKGALPKGFDKPVPKPEPKKAEAAEAAKPKKPKGALPKGFDKPAPKPAAEKPKPAESAKPPAATIAAALEDAYYNAPQTDFHKYRTNVTGYTPAANRYYVRLTAPVGTVPTTNWNEQKAKVTGYTQPSNQYFATRARLAYHPPDKSFGSFSGTAMSVGVTTAGQEQQAPKPESTTAASKSKGTLPKGF